MRVAVGLILPELSHTAWVAWSGAVLGIVFGAVVQRTGFCLTRGLRQWWLEGDGRKARAFALAAAVAVLGTQALVAMEWVDLRSALYLQGAFSWLVLPLGGALFGYGMVVANGCGSRALVLLGSGNLRSFVVLVCLGISAYVALTGVLAPLRIWLVEWTVVMPALRAPHLPGVLEAWGATRWIAQWVVVAVIAGGLIFFAVGSPAFRASPRDWIGGLAVGAMIPAGWWITGVLGADDFDPVTVASLTFVAPIGDTIQYAMFATGMDLGFGVAVVVGVLLGAAAAAALSGTFRLEGFPTPRRMLRSMAGGALMGIGGALALGCSVGQGLTGLSTLALPSFLAAGGILLGALAAIKGPLRLSNG